MDEPTGPNTRPEPAPPPLDVALRGSLPCLNCGYELQGLSVRGACPECGVAVRATILHRVDPHAEAFHPLPTPTLTANAVFFWSLGGLLAVAFGWAPRLSDFYADLRGVGVAPDLTWTGWASLASLALSALASLGLIHATREIGPGRIARAAAGVLFYLPLAWCWWRITQVIDLTHVAPYLDVHPNPTRLGLRVCLGAAAIGMLLLVRPNVRALVARSLVLRTGRVDRQTIFATTAAIALAMAGDTVRLISTALPDASAPLVASAGALLVLIGSILITIALIGATVDGWRLRASILSPGLRLSELLEVRPNGS